MHVIPRVMYVIPSGARDLAGVVPDKRARSLAPLGMT
jgi:hypothetical protein